MSFATWHASGPPSTLPLLRASLHDRTIGALVGSALGDTIGLYTEFLSSTAAAEAYPSHTFTLLPPGPTPFKLDIHRAAKTPGHWTDDTDHALLLLLGYLHTASTTSPNPPPLPTPVDLAARLRVWVQQGLRPLDTMPLGLGRLVGTVVASQGFATDPARVAREYWDKTGRRMAPNGSLMRTHPLGLMCLWRSEAETFEVAAAMSRVTHADPRCVLACVLGSALVRAVVRGEVVTEGDLDGVVARAVAWFGTEGGEEGEELDMAELERHVGSEVGLGGLELDDPPKIGYVYKTLGAGVVLLRMAIRRVEESGGGVVVRGRMFEELVTELIMCGGDADTNACFAGALLGAYLGYAALPGHWKYGMTHGEWFAGKAEALCRVLGLADGTYVGEEDADTRVDGGREPVSQNEMEGRWMVLQQEAFKKVSDVAKASAGAAEKRGSHGPGWSGMLSWRGRDKSKR
ncbi:ADP-ribosylglycohydrolase-domain-containing protein [Podospora appendiculata]|uniref:ADP-ribosylglycohydrolase-domain-containing protein n=1 Tax=Podospora appendiculata TaxID=314037 RepID=A0AAE1CE40_9PEZI|nr:ADP-ribosylglycohydrolase-domain-containing protein [Podospora appendiculata]